MEKKCASSWLFTKINRMIAGICVQSTLCTKYLVTRC